MIQPLHPWQPSTGYQVKKWAEKQQKVLRHHQRFNFILFALKNRDYTYYWLRLWRLYCDEELWKVYEYAFEVTVVGLGVWSMNWLIKWWLIFTYLLKSLLGQLCCFCQQFCVIVHIFGLFSPPPLVFEAQLVQVGKSYMGCFLFIPLIVNNFRGSCPQVFTACMWCVTSAVIA